MSTVTTTVHETWDVSAMLSATTPQGNQGAFIDGLKDECGPIIGRVLDVVETLTGRDLLKELLDPIAGDFQAVSAMQHGWLVMAEATGQVADNHEALAEQLAHTWEGEAAAACLDNLGQRVAGYRRQSDASLLVADQLEHLIEVARETAHVVCAVLEFLDSIVQDLLLSAAGAGMVKAIATSPGKAVRAARLIDDGVRAIETLRRVAQEAIRAIRDLQALLDVANTVVDLGEIGGHVGAGGWLEETTGAGF